MKGIEDLNLEHCSQRARRISGKLDQNPSGLMSNLLHVVTFQVFLLIYRMSHRFF